MIKGLVCFVKLTALETRGGSLRKKKKTRFRPRKKVRFNKKENKHPEIMKKIKEPRSRPKKGRFKILPFFLF